MPELRLYESWEEDHRIERLVRDVVDTYGIRYKPYRALLSTRDHARAVTHGREAGVHWTYHRQARSDDGPLRLYVQTQERASKYSPTVLLHRLVMDPPRGMVVDHLDGNTLNNERRNLRIVTVARNNANRRFDSSAYLGVRLLGNQWVAEISARGRWIPLGVYTYERSAARAYDDAAWRLRGDRARLNFD